MIPAATAALYERPHEAGVIARRVGANQNDQVTMMKIFKLNCCGARSGDTGHGDPGCLVTEVGAVVDVVGSTESGHELKEKPRLV